VNGPRPPPGIAFAWLMFAALIFWASRLGFLEGAAMIEGRALPRV
jgi:hypothetical protein